MYVCMISDMIDVSLYQECGRICETVQSRSDYTYTGIFEPVTPKDLERFPSARVSLDDYTRIRSAWPCSERVVPSILFSEKIQSLIHSVIPDDARLFNEQYIVKPSHSGTAGEFAWHRDADSICDVGIRPEDVMYVSIWVALDDMTEENGCLFVRPMTGTGDDVALEIPRGSAVLMSHVVHHKSGPNRTKFQRRAWMPQFSRGPIQDADGCQPLGLALPLV